MLRAKDFRAMAWQKMSGNWGILAVITLIFGVIVGALGASSIIGVGAVGLLILTGPLMLGMTNCFLAVSRRQTVQVETMFSGFNNFLNAMLLYIINAVLIALWSCLLVIPGIIKYFSYSMSYYILADHPELSANEARKQSMVLMQGNKWRLFCLEFSFIGWLILCALTCGILTFWIQPYIEVACCEFYHSLINKDTTQPEFDQTTGDGSTVEQTDFYTNTENN